MLLRDALRLRPNDHLAVIPNPLWGEESPGMSSLSGENSDPPDRWFRKPGRQQKKISIVSVSKTGLAHHSEKLA